MNKIYFYTNYKKFYYTIKNFNDSFILSIFIIKQKIFHKINSNFMFFKWIIYHILKIFGKGYFSFIFYNIYV